MLNLPSAKPRLMKAVFWDNPLLPDRWKSTALQSVSVIDCWCEIVPTSKMVRAATNTADNHEKTALCARPQEMKIQQYGGSGCAPFCNGHTWAKVQITDLLTRTCWLGWSPRHVKCRSACKLDSPNYHINDVSSFIRLRACISNSFAHAWRSQEKAITPNWSWILLHVSVQVGMFGDTNGIGENSWIYSSQPMDNQW